MAIELENQIILSDCFEVMKQIPDGSIDCIITDPPYKYLKHRLDADYSEELFINEVHRILKPNSFLGFFGRGESFYKLNYLASQKGFSFKEEIIWDKCYMSSHLTPIGRYHEIFCIWSLGNMSVNKIRVSPYRQWIFSNPQALFNSINRFLVSLKKINSLEDLATFKEGCFNLTKRIEKHKLTAGYLDYRKDRGYDCYRQLTEGISFPSILRYQKDFYSYEHPTQKPTELLKRLIELLTKENDLILDPFAGSGSLGVACVQTNRRYCLIEKESDYHAIAVRRVTDERAKPKQLTLTLETSEENDNLV